MPPASDLTLRRLIKDIQWAVTLPYPNFGEGIAMKTLAALLLTAAIGLVFAAGSYAECGPSHKTAQTTAPSTPAPSTTKAG
jgi:hypothetical protein